MNPHRKTASILLLLVVLLYWYGSFYPFQFDWDRLRFRLSAPIGSWLMTSMPWNRVDVLFNVLAYIPVGGLLMFVWRRQRVLLATAIGGLISLTAELGQNAFLTRDPSVRDLAANTAGSAIGATLAVWLAPKFIRYAARIPFVTAVLLLLWIALHAAPFLPSNLTQLQAALRELGEWRWSIGGTAWWIASWTLLFALLRRFIRLRYFLFMVAPVSILFKLLIEGQRLSPDEILALFFVAPCLFLLKDRTSVGLLLMGVVIHGLAPFHLRADASASFEWRPFAGFLESKPDQVFLTVIQKLYLYLGGVWLISESGWNPARAGIALAVLLALIEFSQLFVTGHTAEIADPLMALLAIFVVRSEGHRRKSHEPPAAIGSQRRVH